MESFSGFHLVPGYFAYFLIFLLSMSLINTSKVDEGWYTFSIFFPISILK